MPAIEVGHPRVNCRGGTWSYGWPCGAKRYSVLLITSSAALHRIHLTGRAHLFLHRLQGGPTSAAGPSLVWINDSGLQHAHEQTEK